MKSLVEHNMYFPSLEHTRGYMNIDERLPDPATYKGRDFRIPHKAPVPNLEDIESFDINNKIELMVFVVEELQFGSRGPRLKYWKRIR